MRATLSYSHGRPACRGLTAAFGRAEVKAQKRSEVVCHSETGPWDPDLLKGLGTNIE